MTLEQKEAADEAQKQKARVGAGHDSLWLVWSPQKLDRRNVSTSRYRASNKSERRPSIVSLQSVPVIIIL